MGSGTFALVSGGGFGIDSPEQQRSDLDSEFWILDFGFWIPQRRASWPSSRKAPFPVACPGELSLVQFSRALARSNPL